MGNFKSNSNSFSKISNFKLYINEKMEILRLKLYKEKSAVEKIMLRRTEPQKIDRAAYEIVKRRSYV